MADRRFDTALAIAELDAEGATVVKHPAILRSLREWAPWPLVETDWSDAFTGWVVLVERGVPE